MDRVRLSASTVREIAFQFVQHELHLDRNALESPRRCADLVEGRALFVWIVKTRGPAELSYPQIGRWLGNRDHSTIQHLYKVKVPQLRHRNADFGCLCARFERRLTNLLEKLHGDTCH